MSCAKSQGAVATNTQNLSSGQQQQNDLHAEESLGRQNNFELLRRGNMKGKHLTRSHAMSESTSPPQTPTPRPSVSLSPNGYRHPNTDGNEGNKKLHTQSPNRLVNSSIMETPTVIVASQHKQQQSQQQSNVALCNETEFPKLIPPKSKSGSTAVIGGGSSSISDGVNNICSSSQQRINSVYGSHNSNNNTNGDNERHHQKSNNVGSSLQKPLDITESSQSTQIYRSSMNYQLHTNDKSRERQKQVQSFMPYDEETPCTRNESQNSMNSYEEVKCEAQHQSQQHHHRSGGGGKKHRTNSKGSKSRLKNISNNSSYGGGTSTSMNVIGDAGDLPSSFVEGNLNTSNNTSGFISRENSNEQYTDHGGIDLLSFFKETLNKNIKDRQFLLKIEKDLIEFAQEGNRAEIRFPQASSYNRMLIHRTAAFFGMEHNVDPETQQCVIVAHTKNTRIPEIRFKTLVINNREDSRKLILKRDTHSFDEARQSSYLCPDRCGLLDRKVKSFEEREEQYENTRSRIFNRRQNESCPIGAGSTEEGNNYISWTSSVDQLRFSRGRNSGKVLKVQNSPDKRSRVVSQKSGNNNGDYGASNKGETQLRADSVNSSKNMCTTSGNVSRIYSKQESTGGSWRQSPSSTGTVYQYDLPKLSPEEGMNTTPSLINNMANIYQSKQISSPQKETLMYNPIKKQHKANQVEQSQQQVNKLDSVTIAPINADYESVVESSTQTSNVVDDLISSHHILDTSYQENDENYEYANSINGCLSITTSTSTKSYDRIEVQKFKNQATSPNIPTNEKEEIKSEHTNQAPVNVCPMQPSPLQQYQTPQNRDTPHSSRSTPFSNSDTLAKRSSEDERTNSRTQSYQARDGSAPFHTTPNSSSANPYFTTYQQATDGGVYTVPQGMLYAYSQPVEGEFQGYLMPVFNPSQQRSDATNLLPPGTQTIYPTSSATMVPVAAYPAAHFTTTNAAPIYSNQVIYSGEQFQAASASVAATASSAAGTQLQQIATYPIGYPYHYNGYWGQTMTYYVPQQAVSTTSLLAASPASTSLNQVAASVSSAVPKGLTAGPSLNFSSNTNKSTEHVVSGNNPHISHQNGPATMGYQPHMQAFSSGLGSNLNSETTYYSTGRIKRSTPPHFNGSVHTGGHQVVAAAAIPNGFATAAYQLGHAVPTLTLATPPQAAPAVTDLSSSSGGPSTTTMYTLPQHATIFPASMFPYTTNAATTTIVPQSSNASHAAIIQQTGNTHGHIAGGITRQANSTTAVIHNPQHSSTVIAPFYTTIHHHPHSGLQASSHTIHAPGPSAIPIIDATSITNVAQFGSTNNTVACNANSSIGVNTAGASQSAPSTPHPMASSSTILSQRYSSVFATPPVIGTNFSVSSTPHYYGTTEISHQSLPNEGENKNSNSQNSFASHEKRNNVNSLGGKKPHSFQNANINRRYSTSGGGYVTSPKSSNHLTSSNSNDSRCSPSNNTYPRPQSNKRDGYSTGSDKPQTPLLSAAPNFEGSVNAQNTNSNSYQPFGAPIVIAPKPTIRLNAAATAFRHKASSNGNNSAADYQFNTSSQHNSPSTNASTDDNSNNNTPNSINNSSNAPTPISSGGYAPPYMISVPSNGDDLSTTLQTSRYITTAGGRGSAHIPPHLQNVQKNGSAVSAAAVPAIANVPQQSTVLGGAAMAAADNAATIASAAAITHHHQPQPYLSAYNSAASGMYFKYGHTYFPHPSVSLPTSRRSPLTEFRPPVTQVAGIYPAVNMMVTAPPRQQVRHPNYKGMRPR